EGTGWVSSLAFSPDGRWLAAGNTDGSVRVWDFSAGKPVIEPIALHEHDDQEELRVTFAGNSNRLITSGRRHTFLWDLSTINSDSRAPLLMGSTDTQCVTVDAAGRWAVVQTNEGPQLWDLNAEDPSATRIVLKCPKDPVTLVAVCPNARWLVTK